MVVDIFYETNILIIIIKMINLRIVALFITIWIKILRKISYPKKMRDISIKYQLAEMMIVNLNLYLVKDFTNHLHLCRRSETSRTSSSTRGWATRRTD